MKTHHALLLTSALILGLGAATVYPRLRDLRDVRLPSTLTTGHVLVWNGTQWTNSLAYGTATNLASDLSATNLQLVTPKDFTATNITVATEAYDATGWDGDNTVPTKDAVRDKIEAAAGDMTKAVYDTDADNLVDNAEGLVDGATVTNLSTRSLAVTAASDAVVAAIRGDAAQTADIFQIQDSSNNKLAGFGAAGALSTPTITVGGLTVTNGASIGGLSVVTNATVGGTLNVAGATTGDSATFTNGVTTLGTGGGLTTWTDGAADSTVKMTAGADAASNIYWDWSTTDGSDVIYGKGSVSNVIEFSMIDVDSETQAGGTTMAVTFPTGPQYLRDVVLGLTNSINFTNTANAAAGRSVTYYLFSDDAGDTYKLNWDTDFIVVGGTLTQGMVVSNQFVITFKSTSNNDARVFVGGNYADAP